MPSAAAEPSPVLPDPSGVFFSDVFGVSPAILDVYGALDISVVTDLPLFIDPFLLFNSEKVEYLALHTQIIEYLRFLKTKATRDLDPQLINSWYRFGEVEQNWLGFTEDGNAGHGLGPAFAKALHGALGTMLSNFGEETVTESSHIEKLALIRDRVGRDSISDFTTNLIKHYLLRYTETFAQAHLEPDQVETFQVSRAAFNYTTESWATRSYTLPALRGTYVLLTPMDLLTRDDTWINKDDMLRSFDQLPAAVSDLEQRALINNYFKGRLGEKPTQKETAAARASTLRAFPELVDYYIKLKEDTRDEAVATSRNKAEEARRLLVHQVKETAADIGEKTHLYDCPWTSYEEALQAAHTFKHYVEHQDGYLLINKGDGKPLGSERDVQLFFGLVLQATRFDVNREPNNGRGPVDFKISAGAHDKSLIEFKLAKSSSLRRNLQNQVNIYETANKTKLSVKVIIVYSASEQTKVDSALRALGLDKGPASDSVVVIDARSDNKPSASKA